MAPANQLNAAVTYTRISTSEASAGLWVAYLALHLHVQQLVLGGYLVNHNRCGWTPGDNTKWTSLPPSCALIFCKHFSSIFRYSTSPFIRSWRSAPVHSF